MGYGGNTYQIPFVAGGLFASDNIDLMPPEVMIHPSRNLILTRGTRETRPGTAHVNGTIISSSPEVVGGYDFILQNGIQQLVLVTNDGKIYKNFTETIKTGLTVNQIPSFEWFGNELFFTNGVEVPQTWDGVAAGTSDITNPAGDWTTNNESPTQFINHARGNSRRLIGIGCPTTPNTIYFSAAGDAKEFITGVQTVIIETRDGAGIVGGVSFVGRLLVFSRQQAFIVDDSDVTTPSNWGYGVARWNGGAAHYRLIVKTDTDVHVMAEDGEIYSVATTQAFGDYKRGSLTKDAFMHNWIKDNIKLSEIAQFHGIYDPVSRGVYWFVVRNGQATVDTALVYFIDRPPKDAWMVHSNQGSVSGYSARSSFLVRKSVGDYRIYTGGYSGFVWKLGETVVADNGNGYYSGCKTPNLTFEQPHLKKNYKRGRLITLPEGNWDIDIRWWVDGIEQTPIVVSLAGVGSVFDTAVFDTATFGGDEVIDVSFDLGQNGKRIQFEIYKNTAGEKFKLSQLLIDWKPLGVPVG